jgi:nicotinate-nucleotide--dimethylbenzimidazole phosphoribosyltransferase
LLERLDKKPLLDLNMRLGEGSGAALAVGLVRSALACHLGMATFAQAGVSGKD